MNPTAAQFEEAHRIVYQVGVPTDKVVADVAQLIADLDEWHRKLHATQPKYQPDENPSAGQPDEARVEQRHHELVAKIFLPYCEIITEVVDNEAAQLIANSEARAVAAATAELRAELKKALSREDECEAELKQAQAALREAQKDSKKHQENWAYLIGTHKCPVIYQGKLAHVSVHGISTESFEQAKQRAAEKIAAAMSQQPPAKPAGGTPKSQ